MTDKIEMQTVEVDGATKYTMAFPLTDEAGQAILDRNGKPRFTNIIGDTPEDVAVKIAQANIEVTRALDRANKHIDTLKNKKPTPARQAPDMKGKPLTSEEQIQVGLDAQDPRKAASAIQRVVESVVPVAQITEEVTRQAQEIDLESRRKVAREFFGRHPEYNLSANGALLGEWLYKNRYEFTLDNIEIAFATLQDRLARKPEPRNDPPPPAPVRDNAAPGNDAPNPGASPSPQRRAPVGGITNSQASGRPGSELTLTRAQALEMLYKRPREYEAWMADKVKNAILNRALAGR